MRPLLALTVLVTVVLHGSEALFPLRPALYTRPTRSEHSTREIDRGFDDSHSKLALHKRRVPGRLHPRSIPKTAHLGAREDHARLVTRLNGFKVDPSGNPTLPQSAPVDEDNGDTTYFCEVQLGSDPGETVYLLMDTGSSALWVMGEGCTTTACKSHDTFGQSNSKTLSQSSDNFNISYKTGNVAGPIVTDDVSIAGLNLKMEFGLALETTDQFDNYPMDGILGLARQPGTGFTPPTFFQALQQNKVLKSNIFGLNLQRASDHSNDGEINFGGVDTTKFQGDLNYLSTIDGSNWWEIPLGGFSVNGDLTALSSRSAILDSGTSYMFVPPDDAETLFKQIPGSQSTTSNSFTVPCDTNTSISVVFNKVAYEISPKDYVGASVGNGQCTSNIMSEVAVDNQTWLLGDTFMKNVYTVFDGDENRIGFGLKSNSSSSNSSSGASLSGSASSPSGTAVAATASAGPTGTSPLLPDQSGSSASGSTSISPSASSTAGGHSNISAAVSNSPAQSVTIALVVLTFIAFTM